MDIKPKTLLRRVFDFALNELERRSVRSTGGERADAADQAAADGPAEGAQLDAEEASGLSVRALDGAGLRVRWAFSAADVERASPLIDSDAVLCLRLVSFAPSRESVVREVQDRPGLEAKGECEVQLRGERAIVAFGLRAGERFVALSHEAI